MSLTLAQFAQPLDVDRLRGRLLFEAVIKAKFTFRDMERDLEED